MSTTDESTADVYKEIADKAIAERNALLSKLRIARFDAEVAGSERDMVVAAATMDLRAERDRYRKALELIVKEGGAVCTEFEICDHAVCDASCGAWMIAQDALNPVPDNESLT